MALIAYLGIPMTGYDRKKMIQLSKRASKSLKAKGIETWSPVLQEKVLNKKGRLTNKDNSLDWKWPMDKDALNRCFVFINLRADEKSFGCEDEYGRHRYSEWQPCIRISPRHSRGYKSIANYQTDLIVANINEAAVVISQRWGTRTQRVLWKLGIWFHSGPKWLVRQLRRLFQ